MQVSLLQRKQEGAVANFHLLRLLGQGKVLSVDDMQNEERFIGIASDDFHESVY